MKTNFSNLTKRLNKLNFSDDGKYRLIHLVLEKDLKYAEKIDETHYIFKPYTPTTMMQASDSTERVCLAGCISDALISIGKKALDKRYLVFSKIISEDNLEKVKDNSLLSAEDDYFSTREIALTCKIKMQYVGEIIVNEDDYQIYNINGNKLTDSNKIRKFKEKFDNEDNADELFTIVTDLDPYKVKEDKRDRKSGQTYIDHYEKFQKEWN